MSSLAFSLFSINSLRKLLTSGDLKYRNKLLFGLEAFPCLWDPNIWNFWGGKSPFSDFSIYISQFSLFSWEFSFAFEFKFVCLRVENKVSKIIFPRTSNELSEPTKKYTNCSIANIRTMYLSRVIKSIYQFGKSNSQLQLLLLSLC